MGDKSIRFSLPRIGISSKKVLDKGIIFADRWEGHPVPGSPARSHFFIRMIYILPPRFFPDSRR